MLNPSQLNHYNENGFIVLSNVFTEDELEDCSSAYDELFKTKSENVDSNMEATWDGKWKDNELIKTSVLSIHNLQCHDAVFTKMLLNENLLNAVSQLIGSQNILLHHTKAHVKPPEIGSPFPTHQDYHYFPYKNDSMVAVFINLDASDPSNGGLAVFPGSHKLGPQENKSDSPNYFHVDQARFSLTNGIPVKCNKGDVIIFSYLLIHGSYPNNSNRTRRMLLFQMVSAEDEPLTNVHISPCRGMVLKGKNVAKEADLAKRHS